MAQQIYVDWSAGNDYTGASFNDGAFANATLTLTKAGAFANASVDHWLYLTDNGSGEVTAGYYRITSVAGAPNAVVLNADIRSGANDPTDVVCTQASGAIGLPFRSIQGALDLITSDDADGDQINVKSSAAQELANSLNLDELGTPTNVAPLIIRGYDATANDGGVAEIDCKDMTMFAATNYPYVFLVDLEVHSGGDNNLIELSTYCFVFRCEVHKGGSSPNAKSLVKVGNGSQVNGCYVHDIGTGVGYGIYAGSGAVVNNLVECGASLGAGYGIYTSGIAVQNIVVCENTTQNGIYIANAFGSICQGNSLYNSSAGTGIGIYSNTSRGDSIMNNIIVGWSGVGGSGIQENNMILTGYNAFYNCTNDYSVSDQTWIDETAKDVALVANPYTNAGALDFSLTAAAKTALRSLGWPEQYLGAHASTDGHITIGAIQYGAAEAAAGGRRPRIRLHGG